ncbi:hypothetical protein Ciccas_011124 [Cichlidogyrus casuarinus]|uniref:Uncharacterized protein n=1 Tax=Cichlidogyrus casuarinus TaxID=1844966 RepID=A0ABD2PTT3_9PLAT
MAANLLVTMHLITEMHTARHGNGSSGGDGDALQSKGPSLNIAFLLFLLIAAAATTLGGQSLGRGERLLIIRGVRLDERTRGGDQTDTHAAFTWFDLQEENQSLKSAFKCIGIRVLRRNSQHSREMWLIIVIVVLVSVAFIALFSIVIWLIKTSLVKICKKKKVPQTAPSICSREDAASQTDDDDSLPSYSTASKDLPPAYHYALSRPNKF